MNELLSDINTHKPNIPGLCVDAPFKIGDMSKIRDYILKLEDEVSHLSEYTDHLVAFSKLPCLPKDVELLRAANAKFAQENCELREKLKVSKV